MFGKGDHSFFVFIQATVTELYLSCKSINRQDIKKENKIYLVIKFKVA